MPQCRQPSLSQKGSILVAVLGFSVILSMAAASLMIVAGNARNDEDNSYFRMQCFNDAESGLMMGVGWLRNQADAKAFITGNQGWAGATQIIIPGQTFENGSVVTVTVVDNFPAPTKTVISLAVKGSATYQASWDVGAPDVGGPANDGIATDGLRYLSLTNWRSP
ncbi:MAG TPA: hypothetical protein VJ385_22695 [Fibrobacteria bacterium]|nr:hypothetical protein [Fibrobacteria bacterium]